MEKMHLNSAGIDIGSQKIFIGLEGKTVSSYGTFTSEFKRASMYLKENGITSVAMEATGSYWIILYDILVADGFDVWLVDGRQTRQVPGRKTDVKDCQWIQQLHSYGLLNRCFVAEGKMKELRSYQRLREDHIRSASMHINHMQKALIEMNIRLPEVLSQVHGASGIAIIESILAGERDAEKLLQLCHVSLIKNKSAEILKALEGFYTPAGLFALRQAYDGYQFYQRQIADCDRVLAEVLREINNDKEDLDLERRKPIRHNKPDIENLGGQMVNLFDGKDATILPGITDYSWMQIYSETGNDLSKWQTEKHFVSWLGLAPGQHNSGKKKGNRKKGRPSAGQIFRTLAQSLIQSKNIAFGAFARRLKSRKGPGIAIKALARKLAVQYWRLMQNGVDFIENGVAEYAEQLKKHQTKYLKKLAVELGVEVIF